jgi:hypothetical protein
MQKWEAMEKLYPHQKSHGFERKVRKYFDQEKNRFKDLLFPEWRL